MAVWVAGTVVVAGIAAAIVAEVAAGIVAEVAAGIAVVVAAVVAAGTGELLVGTAVAEAAPAEIG